MTGPISKASKFMHRYVALTNSAFKLKSIKEHKNKVVFEMFVIKLN